MGVWIIKCVCDRLAIGARTWLDIARLKETTSAWATGVELNGFLDKIKALRQTATAE
jgi:hypothetical protein